MSIGLGQMLIGGLLGSQLFGGKEKEPQKQQQPTQVASNTTQQGQGGFGGIISGFSNSIFKGMSQEQVARLGIGFNSMRLRPDDNMAASFQTKINRLRDEAKLTKTTNATIEYLKNAKSAQYPNGRFDLVDMLQKGIITPQQAIDKAWTVTKPSVLTEKFIKFEELAVKYKGSENIPDFELQLLGITDSEVNSIKEYQFYQEKGGKLDYMSFLSRGSTDATSIEEFEYYKKTLPTDEKPMSYSDFLKIDAPSTTVTIEAEQTIVEENAFWKQYNEKATTEIMEWGRKSGDVKGNIIKLKEALRQLEDPNNLLTGPIIGQMPDFIMAFLNPTAIDAREAIEAVVQRNLKAVLGGQFTEREGEKLIKRAYNPLLSREINAKRLRILIEQMDTARLMQDARSDWIHDPKNNGSMRGFDGELPTMEDFWSALSANKVGDIVCDSGADNKDRQCYSYSGGDDKEESNWKLVE